jgi:hypothetical protein
MHKSTVLIGAVVVAGIFGCLVPPGVGAQQPETGRTSQAREGRRPESAPPFYELEEAYLRWPLRPEDQAYAAIDGKHLKEHVRALTAISRRYRDAGHQHWGRIMGTEADAENAQWLADKFRKAGLSDVRNQSIDLPPMWLPASWEVHASGGGKTVPLVSAEPSSRVVTPPGGAEYEAVYVGLGTAADFAGRDIRGKAVFIHAVPMPGVWVNSTTTNGAAARAEAGGAAAIFTVVALPGNVRTQRGGGALKVPAFSLGLDDGNAVRELIESAPAGQGPRIRVRFEGTQVSGRKTANVWGTLPGVSDEKIIIVAHRDGYFDSANDNATGVATMLGLAEYFAKIPADKRRRTIQFVGTPGHHGGVGAPGISWMAANKDTFFAKTALLINCEHTARVDTTLFGYGPRIRTANQAGAFMWYVGGGPALAPIVVKAFDRFGVATYADPDARPPGEIGGIFEFAPSLQIIDAGMYYHTDRETDETVPPTGLESVTRAFARIIDEVNKVELRDLARRQTGSAQR